MTTATHPATTFSRANKTGFVLAILAAVPNLAVVPTPDGQQGPPLGEMIGSAVIAVSTIVAVIVGWRAHKAWAVRVAAGGTLILALAAMPAFFVAGIPVAWRVLAGICVVAAIAAVILMFHRSSPHPTASAAVAGKPASG